MKNKIIQHSPYVLEIKISRKRGESLETILVCIPKLTLLHTL